MAARIKLNITSHCQFWFAGEEAPVVTRVIEYRYVWIRTFGNFKNGILQPYLMQCVIPPSHAHRIPDSVSVVGKRCDKPMNNLRVVYNPPPTPGRKKDFAVCVKGLDIDNDISVNIVEWLELMFLLGADKVFLYDYGSHPNITKVLRHYAARGKVDLKRLTLPGVQPNVRGLTRRYHKAKVTNKRQNEIIPYNDCLYRNIARYKFIVLVDIDEVIMPRNASGWRELMQQVAPKAMSGEAHPRSSYYVRNVYFLDSMQEKQGWDRNVPRFMHMLQHVHRAINYTAPTSYIKAFHDTERVQTLHNHFPFSCLMNNCSSISIPTTKAHLQHYRKDCVNDLRKLCAYYRNHTVMDQAILRYKEPLKRATLKTLRDLKFV
ncbi:hypothetical protein GWK47_014154 [Chionoecetes opilio]|uniref:Glycosyltransferase family 92 protein n=1 Tax=Chionoecetes opilio TaxID=41210 RepID=A0A8J5C0R5_CHIOP|nr:hypothetical protein GWK47_014154 [Chionoecetes opilio]